MDRSCRYSSKLPIAASSASGDFWPQLGWYQSGCSLMWATKTARTRPAPPRKTLRCPRAPERARQRHEPSAGTDTL
eukprot:11757819-Alexandrium_andersonii.AAC.1